MRTLIFLLLLYLGYRTLRNWMERYLFQSRRGDDGRPMDQVDDVMIQDPYCKVYFPRRKGLHLHLNGEDLYFCSTECRDAFLAAQDQEKSNGNQ